MKINGTVFWVLIVLFITSLIFNYYLLRDNIYVKEQISIEKIKFENEREKLDKFAVITGRIVGSFASVSIDTLLKHNYLEKPYDISGEGFIIDTGIRNDGIKYYIDTNNYILNWEPYHVF